MHTKPCVECTLFKGPVCIFLNVFCMYSTGRGDLPVGLLEVLSLLDATEAPPLPVLPKDLMSNTLESGAEFDNGDAVGKYNVLSMELQ